MPAPTSSAWAACSTRWRPGRPPFGGRSTAEVFAALLMKDPPPVSSLNPAMPSALDPIVAKLLAKDRDQRYRSAEELLADLEAISGSASLARHAPAGGFRRFRQLRLPLLRREAGRRRPRNRMIVIGALLLVALAGGAFLFRNHLGTKPGPAPSAAAPPSADQAAKPAASERQHHRRRLHQQDRRPCL